MKITKQQLLKIEKRKRREREIEEGFKLLGAKVHRDKSKYSRKLKHKE